jgi:peptidoglycan hydrolase-like protein with peptidoglycan-binding domain
LAGDRQPGSIGRHGGPDYDIDDGTLVRYASPVPGPLGGKGSARRTGSVDPLRSGHPAGGHKHTSSHAAEKIAIPPPPRMQQTAPLPLLRKGVSGESVKRVQKLLNARLRPSSQLTVDGIFGPLTHQAVTQYQQGVSLTVDGIVGKQTWHCLMKGDVATVRVAPAAFKPAPVGVSAISPRPAAPQNSPSSTGSPQASSAAGVGEWSLTDKFAEALRRTGPKLPASMQNEFAALLTPASIAIVAGTLALWAAGHFFGVSEAVDVVLLLSGVVFLGMAAFTVGEELGNFLAMTCNAESRTDLDDAASHLAHAIAIMGVAAFMALLAKVAAKFGKGGKGGGKGELAEETNPKKPASPSKEQTPKSENSATGKSEPPTRKTKPGVMKSIGQDEIDLAASEGTSVEQQAARRRVAEAFYKEHSGFQTKNGKLDTNKINDHLKGIDYTKPVQARTAPPPESAVQWQVPNGKQGQYYAKPETSPSELGIGRWGLEESSSGKLQVAEKQPVSYPSVQEGTPVLESTAARMDDTWSLGSKGDHQTPITQPAKGGGIQYFIPDKSAVSTK